MIMKYSQTWQDPDLSLIYISPGPESPVITPFLIAGIVNKIVKCYC